MAARPTYRGPLGYPIAVAATSLHGITMVAVAVITGGVGNYLVPLMIGAQGIARPPVNALSCTARPPWP